MSRVERLRKQIIARRARVREVAQALAEGRATEAQFQWAFAVARAAEREHERMMEVLP